jgi:hypothetical protein
MKHFWRLRMLLSIFMIFTSVAATQSLLPKGEWRLHSGALEMKIEEGGGRFAFSLAGSPVIGEDRIAGIVLNGEPTNIQALKPCAPDQCSFQLVTQSGRHAELLVSLTPHHAALLLKPAATGDEVRFQTAGAAPAFGLADHAVLHSPFQTDVTGFADDHFLSGEGLSRLVSNFVIYPRQRFAALLVDATTKIIHSSQEQIVQGVAACGAATTMHYFFGSPHEIYSEYRKVRVDAGYPVMKPKEEMFGVGWEAFGALGWNTNQQTVQESVDRYLSLGYPLRWIVIGSGFWPPEERFHETTSFGLFDLKKYPDARALTQHFHSEGLKVLFGLRICFITTGPFAVEGVRDGYFLQKDNNPAVYKDGWPTLPYYLLDAHNSKALDWYMSLVKRWGNYGVNGFKEDYYGFRGFGLRDDKVDPTNNRLMQQGADVIERNGYLSSDGDLHRINDFNFDQNQDRGPVNALALAYAGFPLVYPDIVGGTFGENHFSVERTARMETYMMRNALWASLHSSMSMGEPPWSFTSREVGKVMLAAAQLHGRLQPYLYAQGVRFSADGYPWPMTPLPIAFPGDPHVYGRENDRTRGYEWLIGTSLLATPLYGNDYATVTSRDIYLPEGKWIDYDNGHVYQGGQTLKAFPLPLNKTPLFVGGDGLVIERIHNSFVARIYSVGTELIDTFMLPGAREPVIIKAGARNGNFHAVVIDETEKRTVPSTFQRFAHEFPIEGGHRYRVEVKP